MWFGEKTSDNFSLSLVRSLALAILAASVFVLGLDAKLQMYKPAVQSAPATLTKLNTGKRAIRFTPLASKRFVSKRPAAADLLQAIVQPAELPHAALSKVRLHHVDPVDLQVRTTLSSFCKPPPLAL